MVGRLLQLPPGGWTRVVAFTVCITVIVVSIATAAACAVMQVFNDFIDLVIVATAVALPVVLVPPIVMPLLIRHLQLKRSNAELHALAYRDVMLGCLNRRGFMTSLDIALEFASGNRPCALLIIDADNFKQVNDRFGHDKGDQALQIIVTAIKSAIRGTDVLGRVGGEEFGVFLPGAGDNTARSLAERIREAVAAAVFAPEGERYSLSVSIGGSIATRPTQFSDLYRAADQRLYAAKQDGRNRADFERGDNDEPIGPVHPRKPEDSAVA